MDDAPDILIEEGFLNHSEALLETLKNKISWDERMRARKTASVGIPYNYSGMEYPVTEMLPELLPICQKIQEKLHFYPNNCLVNYYPDGESSMGFHSDATESLAEGTGVSGPVGIEAIFIRWRT